MATDCSRLTAFPFHDSFGEDENFTMGVRTLNRIIWTCFTRVRLAAYIVRRGRPGLRRGRRQRRRRLQRVALRVRLRLGWSCRSSWTAPTWRRCWRRLLRRARRCGCCRPSWALTSSTAH